MKNLFIRQDDIRHIQLSTLSINFFVVGQESSQTFVSQWMIE